MRDDEVPTEARMAAREARRLSALATYAVLDTLPEADLDDIVRLAARICAAPVSLITLVDDVRQFFKARSGYEGAENAPLDAGFCPHVVRAAEPLVIPDTRSDPGYLDNPATVEAGVRFCAGLPLLTSDGMALGILCVLDKGARPTGLDATQVEDLEALARQVMGRFQLRRALRERDDALRNRTTSSRVSSERSPRPGAPKAATHSPPNRLRHRKVLMRTEAGRWISFPTPFERTGRSVGSSGVLVALSATWH